MKNWPQLVKLIQIDQVQISQTQLYFITDNN